MIEIINEIKFTKEKIIRIIYKFLKKHFPSLADKMFWYEFKKSKKRIEKH